MATEQAKRAIAKMKQAGFARSDFRVKTDTKVRQRTDMIRGTETYRIYGDAIITCLASKEEATGRIEAALEAGLDVMVYYIGDKPGYPYFHEAVGDTGMLIEQHLDDPMSNRQRRHKRDNDTEAKER